LAQSSLDSAKEMILDAQADINTAKTLSDKLLTEETSKEELRELVKTAKDSIKTAHEGLKSTVELLKK
jgi:cellobiose-specific phosphotransferase system component IIA